MNTGKDPNVLIIDDEEAVCWALQRALTRLGHSVAVAASAEQAFDLLDEFTPQVIILDIRLPGMDGLTALGRFRNLSPGTAIIVVTAFGNLPTAVQAMQGGAFDYLTKPFDLNQALDAVQRALQRQPTETNSTAPATTPEELIGASSAMQQVFKRIALVAPHDACVLITGESGTGKELVARAIHRYSSRCDRPFLPVHIAALNPNLVESELFGHSRGAFTGASGPRTGLLALADGGTVLLDEIAEVPLPVQVKLLRVLEQKEIIPVGSAQPIPLDLRILAATHQDLPRAVAEGRFRHDLYFRLKVFEIHLPALRDRPEDIEPLIHHFLRRIRPSALPLLPGTLQHLESLPWLGNIRELRNALEHAVILARDGPLLPEHFPIATSVEMNQTPQEQLLRAVRRWVEEKVRSVAGTQPANLYNELLTIVEATLLEEVMRRLKGNRWVAAQWLGLNRATVRKKLAAHGLADIGDEEASDEENEPRS